MIRRVLLSTLNYDHPQKGVARAFASVFPEVHEFDFFTEWRQGMRPAEVSERFVRCAAEVSPDWIWLQVQETDIISPEAIMHIRKILPRCIVSHWMGDCHPSVGAYSASVCRATHLSLVSNVGQLPLYKAAGASSVRYCQVGVDWEEDVLGLPDWCPSFKVPDVVFCANYYGGEFPGTADRVEALDALWDARISVGVVGRGWPSRFPVVGQCAVKEQHHIWTRAKVALSINNFNDIELYYSDRQLIAMASGTPVVCKYVPGLEKEFANGVDCLWYRTSSELVSLVTRLLSDQAERRRIGSEGRAAIMRNHTWWHRILEVLPMAEHIRNSLSV